MARARTTLPRLAVNATLAGFWAAALLALLIFYVNSSVTLTPRNYLPLAFLMMAIYGPVSGVIWSLLAGAVRLFVAFRVRIPWVGFRPFWRFLVADFFLLSLLYVYNLARLRDYLPQKMVTHLTSATVLLVAGTALFALGALRRGFGRRRERPAAAMIAAVLLTGALFGIRERYRDTQLPPSASEIEVVEPRSAIVWLGIDGVSPDDLFRLISEGRLPTLADLVDTGASAPLRGGEPPRPAAAWSSLLTGRQPAAHGVVDPFWYRPRWGQPLFQVAPVWMGLAGLEAMGVLAFDVPAMPSGSMPTVDHVLARCGYRVVARGWQELLASSASVSPSAAAQVPGGLQSFVDAIEEHRQQAQSRADGAPLAAALTAALQRDLPVMNRTLAALQQSRTSADAPPAVLVRLAGLQEVARVFMRYRRPDAFGNVRHQDVERFGAVLPDYYRLLDAWLALVRRHVGSDATVIVMSPYAVEPVALTDRVQNALAGRGHLSGSHHPARPGVLLFNGPGVRRGARLERASTVDVLPTLLFLRDLPVGRDMEGEPMNRVVTDTFADQHALAVVPSWETVTVVSPRR